MKRVKERNNKSENKHTLYDDTNIDKTRDNASWYTTTNDNIRYNNANNTDKQNKKDHRDNNSDGDNERAKNDVLAMQT